MYGSLPPESVGWLVGPTYDVVEKIFRVCYWAFMKHCPELIRKASYSRAGMELRLANGSVIKAKSADNPDSLIGEGLDWLIIDEAARIKRNVWESALRPSLADKKGWGVFISTPRGMDWFRNLHSLGQDPTQKEFASWRMPSMTNPHLPPEEFALMKEHMPDRLFRQEVLAEFIDDAGGVFRGVKECVRSGTLVSASANECVIGIDLAKHQDFSVIIIIDKVTKDPLFYDRFQRLDWPVQVERIANAIRRFPNSTVVVDSTGVGDGIYDMLRNALADLSSTRVNPYLITTANKKELVDNLAVAIENREICIPDIPEFINELQIYAYTMTSSRNVQYNAPEGYHDDCVMALALAWTALKGGVARRLPVFGIKNK